LIETVAYSILVVLQVTAMSIRSCVECGKGVKSLSGLSRHLDKCPVLAGKKKRGVDRDVGDRRSSGETSPYRSQPAENDETEDIEDGDWIDIVEDDAPRPLSTCQNQSRLSTTASIRIESYEEVTGKKAGQAFDDTDNINHENGRQTPKKPRGDLSTYLPFQSATDFAAAQWFLRAKCTKGDIERFYGDKRLEPMHKLLSFSSHDELLRKIHDIPYGIPDDVWKISEIQVEQDIIGLPSSTYDIRYRDIKSVLEFLMGHEPFEHHLSYAPVRQFSGTSSDNRIYDEMHTGDWWWRTQGEIPEGGTIIPVLLASDKTMLSLHHGDQAAWPVYITIGNLDRRTRRKQTVPGLILLGFLPITSETAENSRARVYHAAMELILKRE
jgi:hypothetical protein